ncbi:MAG: carbon starvation protein A [Nitrospirae bacterium]|nr:carbon starvation protein A [Nitrospirota bacterium]MDA1305504.1 carbon starvation protein A [Nitrospirota bacterium]
MNKLSRLGWIAISILCAVSFAFVTGMVNPDEKVNALWLVTASGCFYVLAYRFYGRFLGYTVMELDDQRPTPAYRLEDGTNYYPANKYVLFGHHFAAIAGAGPLLGPVLAAQFGFLPGFLWIVIGAVLAGAVQDFVILVGSLRRNGQSLPEIARAEIGWVTGMATAVAVLFIVLVALAGLGLAVVNALVLNPWGTFTIAMTIPIAFLMGFYHHKFRPGQVGEMSVIGLVLLILAIIVGRSVAQSAFGEWFNFDRNTLVWVLAGYGFLASILPVWMLLVPRDYLSTFMKLGVIALLALGIIVLAPDMQMPRITGFIHGGGPIIPGPIFPFLFITIACGAISGFHSLVSSGTTPKMIARESQAMVGYGAMLLESFVGVIALISAGLLIPGDYLAINTHLSEDALAVLGYPIGKIHELSQLVEVDVSGRPGGAVSLAVGMAWIFSALPGMAGLMAYWYQFALLFEALFILTTIDAGTRVARYLVQELGGHFYKPLRQINWWPGVLSSSALVVGAWGYLIATGNISTVWPMFGAANQLLGTLALCIATTLLIKMGKSRYMWVTAIPMVFVGVITLAGCYELWWIFLDRAASATESSQSITMYINAGLVGLVAILAIIVLIESVMRWYGYLVLKRPYTSTEIVDGEGIRIPAGPCC